MSEQEKGKHFPYASPEELKSGQKLYDVPYTQMPEPEGGFSKTKMIGDLISQLRKSKEFFRISIPIFFIAPISMLELISLYFTPTPDLLTISKCKSAEDRFLRVVRWAVLNIPRLINPAGISHAKPYNPIIGEKHIWKWEHPDGSVTNCIAEQVSHHPPISAFYISNRKNNFSIRSTINPITKLYPNSFMLGFIGEINLRVHTTGEEFKLEFPPIICYGILLGRQFIEHNGVYKIECEKSKYYGYLLFKEKENNKIAGRIVKGKKKDDLVYKISGYADKKVLIRNAKTKKTSIFANNTSKKFMDSKQKCKPLWELEQSESRRNWHMVSKHLREGDKDKAHTHKDGVENVQRAKRKVRNEKGETWKPKFFELMTEAEVEVTRRVDEEEAKVVKKKEVTKVQKVPLYKCVYENNSKYKKKETDAFSELEIFKY